MWSRFLHKIECGSVQNRLWDYHRGDSRTHGSKGVEAHVAQCPACAAEAEFVRKAASVAKECGAAAPYSARGWDDLRERLSTQPARSGLARPSFLKPSAAVLGAIALAVLIWISTPRSHSGKRFSLAGSTQVVRAEPKTVPEIPRTAFAAAPQSEQSIVPYESHVPTRRVSLASVMPIRRRDQTRDAMSTAPQMPQSVTESPDARRETFLAVRHAPELRPVEPDRSELVSGAVPAAELTQPVALVTGSSPTAEGFGEPAVSMDEAANQGPRP